MEKFHHGFTISYKFLLLSYNIINNFFRVKSNEWNFIWTTDGNEDFNFNDLFSFATLLKKYWKKGLNGLNYLLLGFIWIFLLQSFCLHWSIWMDKKQRPDNIWGLFSYHKYSLLVLTYSIIFSISQFFNCTISNRTQLLLFSVSKQLRQKILFILIAKLVNRRLFQKPIGPLTTKDNQI